MLKWLHQMGMISLVTALLLVGCAKKPENAPCINKVPIGVVIANDTQEGREQREGYLIAQNEINSAGGINGCPIALEFEPKTGSETSTETVQTALLNLDDHGVVAILGATSNEASKRMAALAGYIKTPVIITPDTADDLMDSASRWVFRINPSNRDYADAAFALLQNNPSIGVSVDILFEDTEYGEAAAIVAGQAALERKLVINRYERYSAAERDFAILVNSVRLDRPAMIYWISSDPAQVKVILTQMANQAVQSILVGNGTGFTSSSLLYENDGTLTAGLQNIFLTLPWSSDLPDQTPGSFQQVLNANRQAENRPSLTPPTVYTVQAYTALMILAKAMETVAPISGAGWDTALTDATGLSDLREKTTNALRAGFYKTPYGSLEFDSTGQSRVEALLVQVRDGNLITVFPKQYEVEPPSLRAPSGFRP